MSAVQGFTDNQETKVRNEDAGPRRKLDGIADRLRARPFIPHRLFTGGHAQTLAGFVWPRRRGLRKMDVGESRLFEVEPGVRVMAHCRWQKDFKERPTLLLMHGLEGSSSSVYILSTARKAFDAGLNVISLNLRNCGGTEHLTPTLYNSSMSGDLRAVLRELIERDRLREIFVAGFSMSGNIVLKYAGEEGENLPPEISAVVAVSASVDLHASASAIERRANWIYHKNFMHYLRRRMRRKQKLFPEIYDTRGLYRVRTLRAFDERFTARYGGYTSADDYYTRASSLPLIRNIRVPTLIIHAQDDPFIPYEPLKDESVSSNPFVITLAPRHGGHVGFVADTTDGEDRFWAENRIIEFCKLMSGESNA